MDSILTSIKKLLGIAEEDEHFDSDLIILINTAFEILCQLGVGPDKPFYIQDKTDTWDEFKTNGEDIRSVETYIFEKVKLLFDHPTSSVYAEELRNGASELEWRMNVMAEYYKSKDE